MLSACAFYVYIIQEHESIRYWLWQDIINFASYASNWRLFLVSISFVLALWPLAFVLERFTAVLSKVVSYVYLKIEKIITRIAYKVNSKLTKTDNKNSVG